MSYQHNDDNRRWRTAIHLWGTTAVRHQPHRTAIGQLLIIADDETILRIALDNEPHQHIIAEHHSQPGGNTLTERCAEQIDARLAGDIDRINLPWQTHTLPPFTAAVLRALQHTNVGQTVTYRQLAETSGTANGARACGNAVARNPLPLLIPCHRVIRSDGTTGHWRGGRTAKQQLLKLEQQQAAEQAT